MTDELGRHVAGHPPRLAERDEHHAQDGRPGPARIRTSGPSADRARELPDEHVEAADREAGEQRPLDARRAIRVRAGRPRDEDDGDQRERDPGDRRRLRHALEQEARPRPGSPPTARRWSARRRPSGPTASPRYRLVIPTRPHRPAATARPRSDGDRERLAPHDREREGGQRADGLRHGDDREDGRATGHEAPAEVARAPAQRGDEAKDDDRDPGREVRQAAGSSVATWPSTAVGPSSATTLSACGVVAVRRREVDDLEVAGDLLEQPEGPRGALVVEGHERVVEDERRPAVARHEPDEARSGP